MLLRMFLIIPFTLPLLSYEDPLSRRRYLQDVIKTVTCWSVLPTPVVAANRFSILERLDAAILNQLPVMSTSELIGVDNMYYPDFLAGTFDVTQTLVSVEVPLGITYLGGPNGVREIGEKSLAESQAQLQKPIELQLRFVRTKWGIAEDRLFNTEQRLNNFAGRKVVAKVDYADVEGSNRASTVALGGTQDDPLQTTFTRFRGPAAQKVFVTNHGKEQVDGNHWVGFECQRSIFALTNKNTAPPIFTDSELLFDFTRIDDDHIKGRLRLAAYLNPQDKLYFDANRRAVSLQDYTLDLRRRKD